MRDGSVFDTLETVGLMNGAQREEQAVAIAPALDVATLAPQADYVPFAALPVLDRLRTAD